MERMQVHVHAQGRDAANRSRLPTADVVATSPKGVTTSIRVHVAHTSCFIKKVSWPAGLHGGSAGAAHTLASASPTRLLHPPCVPAQYRKSDSPYNLDENIACVSLGCSKGAVGRAGSSGCTHSHSRRRRRLWASALACAANAPPPPRPATRPLQSNATNVAAQLAFLESSLSDSKADWDIVLGGRAPPGPPPARLRCDCQPPSQTSTRCRPWWRQVGPLTAACCPHPLVCLQPTTLAFLPLAPRTSTRPRSRAVAQVGWGAVPSGGARGAWGAACLTGNRPGPAYVTSAARDW